MPPVRSTRWLPLFFFLFVWTLTTHGKYSVSGDEPHYLIVAHSLVTDGDLDLANNYGNGDGRRFGADGLKNDLHARVNRHGELWSVHDPGLSFLIAPVYAVASRLAAFMPGDLLARMRQPRGLFTYSLVSLAMLALTTWGVSLMFSALLRVAGPRSAFAVTAAMAFSPPYMAHAFLLFPDTVAAVVCCAAVWMWCLAPTEVTARRAMWMALALGLLPWLHRKYVLLLVGLAVVLLHRHRPWFRKQKPGGKIALVGLVVVPAVGLFALTWFAWGSLTGPQGAAVPFSAQWIPAGSLGLLLDRERGLAGYAPTALLLPACWLLAWRQHWPLVVPILLVFIPAAAYLEWWAGFSPAARYLLAVVPLMVLPAAQALQSRWLRGVAVPLVLLQAAISAYTWQFPRTLWPREQGSNQVLNAMPVVGPSYAEFLPSMRTGDPVLRGLETLAAIALVTAVVVLFARRSRRVEAEVQSKSLWDDDPGDGRT
jgi:hypothetical protein